VDGAVRKELKRGGKYRKDKKNKKKDGLVALIGQKKWGEKKKYA